MEPDERVRLIRRYRDGYSVVVDALDGATDDELDRAAGGGWTPRQIVHHLADAEMEGATRIRRLLAESNPQIHGYDEKAFTERLSRNQPVDASLQAVRWARECTALLLDEMSEQDWTLTGTHSERGRYSAEDWLTMYAAHAHDHAAQIQQARGMR